MGTDHPPPDDLRAYGQGLLPAAAAAVVEEHLAGCDACGRVLEGTPDGAFLERMRAAQAAAPAANGLPSTGDLPAQPAGVGAVVAGRYRLLQVIGEGGMGRVFMAEQTRPVKRMVAVKLVRAGMDTKQVLARFEAERQALALMDHPNIAKVLDAGTTDGGQPFFVMELVRGVPITQFCDERKLSVEDRLAVFQQVCAAVQHAHQKGVIHRDLKPSNILVESHDGKPVPKVIDFGLAKALTALPLTDRTLFTQFGAVLGTPMYMAPEQAEFGALDIDTRADVYALGVLLYELLTGTTPLQKERLERAAWDEICRVIKEEEPETPSARLSTVEGRAGVAARRQTEPARLNRFVRGDLDWIVMKALEKDRNRRYPTATALAADLGRFLSHQPVEAGPPTVRYRLQKFLRRHRGRVVATAVVGLALAVGGVGLIWGVVATERRKEAAVSAAMERGLLAALSGDFAAAEAAAADAERAGASPGQVRMLQGQIAFSRGDTTGAVGHLERAAELLPRSVAVRGMLAYVYGYQGDAAKFHAMLEQLDHLPVATPQDALFKGLGESTLDAERGVRTLDAAFGRGHHSVIVRLVQADARASYLQQVRADPASADTAVEDASAARSLLSGNPAALKTSLRTHMIAAFVYRRAGAADKGDVALKQARADFDALERFWDRPDVATVRYYYLREYGPPGEALKYIRRVYEKVKDPTVAYNYAQALYLNGDFRAAADVSAAHNDQDLDWVRLLAVAEADGPEEAFRLYQAMAAKGLSAWEVYNGALVLYLLNREADARQAAGALLADPARFPPLRRAQFRRALGFLAGESTPAEFLNPEDMNRGDQSNAHVTVGLTYLATGDRGAARKEFEATRDLWVIDFIPYDMACLLLSRMDKDKVWPPWIK
jgi:tetratricopeptide (TPR) repeat protein